MKRIFILGFVLLAACSTAPEPTATAEPTATVVPTNTPAPTETATPEPTDTPTITPTPEPVQEIPLVWMLPLIEAIQEAEPDASYTSAPCSNPEYLEFDECVVSVDFCLEDVCTWSLMVVHFNRDLMPIEFIESVTSKPIQVFDDSYYVVFGEIQLYSSGFFMTLEEHRVYACMSGFPPINEIPEKVLPLAIWPIGESIATSLIARFNLLEDDIERSFPNTLSSCI